MIAPSPFPVLDARIVHRVHPGLTIDASIQLGEEFGVLFGPSAAGKSTLLRLLAGLTRPDDGRVVLAGEPLFDAALRIDVPLRRRRIGMIFQDDLLFPHLDVSGNIGFGLSGASRSERVRRVGEIAALCGVSTLLGRTVATLSGGERQRVGLARALAPKPRLLLCDEPVSALDVNGRRRLLDRLCEVQRAERIPVLYVTHSPSEALVLGARMFLIEAGRIVAEGVPVDLLARAGDRPSLRRLEGVRCVLRGVVDEHGPDGEWTRVTLDDGPAVYAGGVASAIGSRVIVAVDGDEILLAVAPVAGLSARNQIEGVVEAVSVHGPEAEVVIRVGGTRWIVSTLASTPKALALAPGLPATMIIKARSLCVEAVVE